MPFTEKQNRFSAGAILFLISFLVYIPALRGGFVWDDDAFLRDNPLIHSPRGLLDFWFSTKAPDYFPLTSTMLWIEWRLFGMEQVWGYHAVNVFLHAGSSILLWRLLKWLGIPGAWFAALLFAIHPVNVEAVAWITQRKSTLPMLFGLLSALLFFQSRDAASGAAPRPLQRTPRYWVALLCFTLALLAKTSVVLLPVALLIVIWWRDGKFTRRDFLATLPFFVIAGALSLVTIWFQTNVAIGDDLVREDGFFSRLAIAGWAIWFYLYKALLPFNLMFVYPRWSADPANPVIYLPLLALLAVFGALWFRRDRPWARAILAAGAVYGVMLFPILGFFNIYFMRYSLVADHWQYPGMPALLALVSAFAARGLQRWRGTPALRGLAITVVAILSLLCWRQASLYKNNEILLRATIEKNPGAWMAHYNLGNALLEGGNLDEAIERFQRAVKSHPDYPSAHFNLANALKEKGRVEDAIASFRNAIAIRPNHAKAHSNMGAALYGLGRHDEAIASFRNALEIRPDSALDHNNLGTALAETGQLSEAVTHFQRALALEPGYADAHYNFGNTLIKAGQTGEGIAEYRRALESRSDHAPTHLNLADALAQSGRFDEAITHYQNTLRLEPASVGAHNNLGLTFLHLGRTLEAVPHLEAALQSRPEDAGLLSSLAWIRATSPEASARNGAQALELASKANTLSGGANPAILHTLAAAQAESGQYSAAVATAERALALASESGNTALAELIRGELAQYGAGKPVRDVRTPNR